VKQMLYFAANAVILMGKKYIHIKSDKQTKMEGFQD
jgi:hypothetical protein